MALVASVEEAELAIIQFFTAAFAAAYPNIPIVGENESTGELPREHVDYEILPIPTRHESMNNQPAGLPPLRDWGYSGGFNVHHKVIPGTGGAHSREVINAIHNMLLGKVINGVSLYESTVYEGMLVDGDRWYSRRCYTRYRYGIQG